MTPEILKALVRSFSQVNTTGNSRDLEGPGRSLTQDVIGMQNTNIKEIPTNKKCKNQMLL